MEGQGQKPLLLAGLLPGLDAHLLRLLRALPEDDWNRPTLCPGWSVKDVVSHLSDTALRRLSAQRDRHFPPPEDIGSYTDLVAYLDRLNEQWVSATRTLSPRILREMAEQTSQALSAFLNALDPFEQALWPVAWAGETVSPNWMDIAREYTERWHHQQTLWEAVGRPSPILESQYGYPAFDTFMRALPFTYRRVQAPEETVVRVRVTGEAGGTWHLIRRDRAWKLTDEAKSPPAATVELTQETAWRVFTMRIDRREAQNRFDGIQIAGDEELGGPTLEMIAIMA